MLVRANSIKTSDLLGPGNASPDGWLGSGLSFGTICLIKPNRVQGPSVCLPAPPKLENRNVVSAYARKGVMLMPARL